MKALTVRHQAAGVVVRNVGPNRIGGGVALQHRQRHDERCEQYRRLNELVDEQLRERGRGAGPSPRRGDAVVEVLVVVVRPRRSDYA